MDAIKCKTIVFWWNEVKPFITYDPNGCPHMWVVDRLYPREHIVCNSHFNTDRALIIEEDPDNKVKWSGSILEE